MSDMDELHGFVDGLRAEDQAREESLEAVFDHIRIERHRQRTEWGDDHDAEHAPGDWTRFVVRHLGRAEQAIEDDKPDDYRRQMVRVATLAVAAIEAENLRARPHA